MNSSAMFLNPPDFYLYSPPDLDFFLNGFKFLGFFSGISSSEVGLPNSLGSFKISVLGRSSSAPPQGFETETDAAVVPLDVTVLFESLLSSPKLLPEGS